MSKLHQIQESVQQVAEAIASVLGMEVTIVDSDMRRIAGTGHYAEKVNNILRHVPVFELILRQRQPLVIENAGRDSNCLTCGHKAHCKEQAQMCCPIIISEKAIGVIALVAFTSEQKRVLLERQQQLFEFLARMADLLASKVAELERLIELKAMKNELETIINAVHEGIVAFDCTGEIIRMNASAKKIMGLKPEDGIGLNINQLFPDINSGDCLQQGKEVANREISGMINKRLVHCVTTLTPWSDSEGVKGAVATLQEMEAVKRIISKYSHTIGCDSETILGVSEAIQKAKKTTIMAARNNISVLIRGESGSGKELFARLLHCMSERKNQPFVALNCAAIPEALLESELFGYEEGAFTGARRGGKPGKFEVAHGGTLFLDEIGDMSLPLQAKLLRVLQEKKIERVGGTNAISVDVRIVSATHKDIETMVEKGEFRQDLYYRINVFPLIIPPLRQRREDLPGLIKHFLEKHKHKMEKEINGIEDEAYRLLISYDWPGNVRELENVMEYLISVETGKTISALNVASRIQIRDCNVAEIMPLAAMERQLILAALNKFGGSLEGKEKAAKALGISKATLYRKVKEYAKA